MLLDTLNLFAATMNQKYPNMNRGGCGIFAVHVAKRLQKVVPTRIKLCDYVKYNLDAIRSELEYPKDIELWHERGIVFVHLVVEFEYNGRVYHYDTKGVRERSDIWIDPWKDGYYVCDGEFHIEEIESFVSDSEHWNERFNRRHIPSIKRRIKNLFVKFIGNSRVYYTPVPVKGG